MSWRDWPKGRRDPIILEREIAEHGSARLGERLFTHCAHCGQLGLCTWALIPQPVGRNSKTGVGDDYGQWLCDASYEQLYFEQDGVYGREDGDESEWRHKLGENREIAGASVGDLLLVMTEYGQHVLTWKEASDGLRFLRDMKDEGDDGDDGDDDWDDVDEEE